MSKFFNTGDVFNEAKSNRLFNGMGRAVRAADFSGAELTNVTDTNFDYEITAGQTSGTIKRIISRFAVQAWDNIKLDVSNLDGSNSLHYTIKDQDTITPAAATTIVASTEITADQDEFIIDISTISRATYTNELVIEFTLARDGVGDASPTLENFSCVYYSENQASEKFESGVITSAANSFDITLPKNYDLYTIYCTLEASADSNGIELNFNDDVTSNYSYSWNIFGDYRRYGLSTSDTKFLTGNSSAEGKITLNRTTELVIRIAANKIVGLGTGNTLIEARTWNTYVTTSIGRFEVSEYLEKATLTLSNAASNFKIGTSWTVCAQNY